MEFNLLTASHQAEMERLALVPGKMEVENKVGSYCRCKTEFEKVKEKLVESIPKMWTPQEGITSFVGMEELKQEVVGSVSGGYSKVGNRNGTSKKWDRLLVFGPTGSGKSHFARAIASHFEALMVTIDKTSFHEWSQNLDLFTQAIVEISMEKSVSSLVNDNRGGHHHHGCVVLLLENFDWWCESNKACQSIVLLLNNVQSYWKKYSAAKLLIMACSYQPWNLDEEVVAAFQKRVYLRPLDFQERKQLIEKKAWELLLRQGLDMTERELREITKRSERLAVWEVCEMVEKAYRLQCRDDIRRVQQMRVIFNPRPLTKIDFEVTLERMPWGKCMKGIFAKFDEFNKEFGNGPKGPEVGVPKMEDKATQVQMDKRYRGKGDNIFAKIFARLNA